MNSKSRNLYNYGFNLKNTEDAQLFKKKLGSECELFLSTEEFQIKCFFLLFLTHKYKYRKEWEISRRKNLLFIRFKSFASEQEIKKNPFIEFPRKKYKKCHQIFWFLFFKEIIDICQQLNWWNEYKFFLVSDQIIDFNWKQINIFLFRKKHMRFIFHMSV